MKIGIIGAGAMGLTLAYRLSSQGHQVHILESEKQIGGLSTWFDYGDFLFDKYYHVILKTDSHLLGLIEELGLSDQLHWQPTKTGFLWQGKHISMSNYMEFLRFPVLNLYQKMRLGFGILYSQYFGDLKAVEHLTAKEWLIKVFGKKVFTAIWEPLLESKFGVLKDQVPASIIMSVLNRYYSTRDKGDGKEYMGHLKQQGLKVLFDTLEKKILDSGGKIDCGAKVTNIETGSAVRVECDGETHTFDKLISTIPTVLLKKLGPTLDIATAKKPPKFLGVIRLALVLKESLSPYYVTNLIDRGAPYTGIIEVSALTAPDELSGKKLVMIPRYDVPDSPWFGKSDKEIEECFLSTLKKTWPELEKNIIRSFVHRERVVQALWIDSPPQDQKAASSSDGKVWSINAELAGRDTLNNNALVGVANRVTQESPWKS